MRMRILLIALAGALLLADGAQAQWGRGYGGGWGGGYGGGYGGGWGGYGGSGAGVSFGGGSTRFSVGYSQPYGGYGYGGYGGGIYAGAAGRNWGGSIYAPTGGYGYGGYSNYSPYYSNYSGGYYSPDYSGYTTGGYSPSTTSFYPSTTGYTTGTNGAVISSNYAGGCGQAVIPSTGAQGTTSFYPPEENATMGLMIQDLDADRAAKRAGFRHGDVITAIGDKQIHTTEDLQDALSKAKGEVEVTFLCMPTMKSEKKKITPVDGKIGATVVPVPLPPQQQ